MPQNPLDYRTDRPGVLLGKYAKTISTVKHTIHVH